MCSFPSTTTPYPRNAIVIESCRLSQAKRRISVLTVTEKSNYWRWIQEWFKETEWGRWYLPMTATERNPDFSKIVTIEADLPKPHAKDEFLTNPWTCPWLIGSIHSHLPVYMAGVSSLLISQGFFICSRKVTRSGLETTRPAIRKRNIHFAGDSSVSNLICIQARREGTCAKSLQLCLTLCHPTDCSPPGSSVHGSLQAKILSGLPWPPPGVLPNPGIEPTFTSPALAGSFFITSATREAQRRHGRMLIQPRTKVCGDIIS